MSFDLAIIDFDKTLGYIGPRDFAELRQQWREGLLRLYGVESPLSPILECLEQIRRENPEAADWVYGRLDESEVTAGGGLYPVARRLLQRLRSARVPVAVVSNNCRRVIAEALALGGCAALVGHIEARTPGLPSKPSAEPLSRAARALRGAVPLQRFLAMGDSDYDLLAAEAFARRTGAALTFVRAWEIEAWLAREAPGSAPGEGE